MSLFHISLHCYSLRPENHKPHQPMGTNGHVRDVQTFRQPLTHGTSNSSTAKEKSKIAGLSMATTN